MKSSTENRSLKQNQSHFIVAIDSGTVCFSTVLELDVQDTN